MSRLIAGGFETQAAADAATAALAAAGFRPDDDGSLELDEPAWGAREIAPP